MPASRCPWSSALRRRRDIGPQGEEASGGRSEAAGLRGEGPQTGLEADVEPLAARRARLAGRGRHERGADALPPEVPRHHRVQGERVCATVPGDVDGADQGAGLPGADPVEAVAGELSAPVGVGGRAAEALGMQEVESVVPKAPRHAQVRGVTGSYGPRAAHGTSPVSAGLGLCVSTVVDLPLSTSEDTCEGACEGAPRAAVTHQ
ncbi:hypothetical protein GCM10023082_14120 [Streptomyces tremellae]|uniref:Uncharacterized protein n=1 Tax=Streptomyces tremellae TaxID=1124239 RepID=A0ABP7EDH9_9ACTN